MEEILIVLLGLVVGSFMNVVIHRLPLEQSIVKPRSACPSCKTPIKAYDNIPVLSYIILLGKCRYCKAHISIRYPLVELFTGFTFWMAFKYFAWVSPLHAAATTIFLCLMIALCLIDLEHMILPDEITLGGAVLFLIYSFFNPQLSVLDAFASAIVSAGAFFALYYFYLRIRKIEGLGHGDIKMMLLLGAFLGSQKLVIAVLIASFSGMLVGFYFILFKRKDMQFALPFGTFLAIGSYIATFWGNDIMRAIQSLYW